MQIEAPSLQKTLGDGEASSKPAPLKRVDSGGWRSGHGQRLFIYSYFSYIV